MLTNRMSHNEGNKVIMMARSLSFQNLKMKYRIHYVIKAMILYKIFEYGKSFWSEGEQFQFYRQISTPV